MVIPDLASPQRPTEKFRRAPVADRVLSVLVDLALFGPVFSLILASVLRQMQFRYYTAPDSTEFWVLLGVAGFAYLILTILTQGLCWSVFGATPGQYFFQLRVVNIHDGRAPTLLAACLRAWLFACEVLLLGVPLVEIFSHPDRRVLHDRAADTQVITLKVTGSDRPHPFEAQFVRWFFVLCSAFTATWSFAFVVHYYRQAQQGAFTERELKESDYLCSEVPAREAGRLDAALAMHLTGTLSADCLSTEIDFAFWRGSPRDQAWASFATALLNRQDRELARVYFDQACAKDQEGDLCELIDWWKSGEGPAPEMKDSWSRSVLVLSRLENDQKIDQWEKELDQLPEDFDLVEFMQAQKIKLLAARGEEERARGGYEVAWPGLSRRSQRNLAADLCFRELTRDCSVRSYSSCTDLEKSLRDENSEDIQPDWLLALAEQRACRKSSEAGILIMARALDPDTEAGQLLIALTPQTGLTEAERLERLRKISFSPGEATLAKSRAFLHLLRRTQDLTDLERGEKLLSQRDLPFRREINEVFLKSADQRGLKAERKAELRPDPHPERRPASEDRP